MPMIISRTQPKASPHNKSCVKTERTDVSVEKCDVDSVAISVPAISYLTMTARTITQTDEKKRRLRKDRVNYPEGSTFNAKTEHLKPQKTMKPCDFEFSLRPSTQDPGLKVTGLSPLNKNQVNKPSHK